MRQQVLDSLKRKNIHYLLTLESTQNYAQELLSKTKPIEGTAILTYNQTKGRGQYGTIWQSAPGKNISVSFILYPGFLPFKDQFLLSKAMALAVADTVSLLLPEKVSIKWPNDLLVINKKIGGILINNTIQGDQWSHSVLGIGLNINQKSFPQDLPFATSAYEIIQEDSDLESIVLLLQEQVMKYYQKLKDGYMQEINKAYLSNLLGYKELLNYRRSSGEIISGEIKDIEENGNLLLKTNSGIESFSIKEISLVL